MMWVMLMVEDDAVSLNVLRAEMWMMGKQGRAVRPSRKIANQRPVVRIG